jgi:flagellar secretion chaperone FliS
MKMSTTEQAYRKTAVAGASGFGLLIALYDTLAGNLRRAADAERSNNIEKRCQELNHAYLVIGYLEDWIEQGSGGELAQKLGGFYSSLRRKIIEAQTKRSAEILQQQMALVLKIRGTWQEIELRRPTTQETPHWAQTPGYLGDSPAQDQRNASSWSA